MGEIECLRICIPDIVIPDTTIPEIAVPDTTQTLWITFVLRARYMISQDRLFIYLYLYILYSISIQGTFKKDLSPKKPYFTRVSGFIGTNTPVNLLGQIPQLKEANTPVYRGQIPQLEKCFRCG